MPSRDDDWKCAYCRKHYVVPSLARWCEQKHEAGDDEVRDPEPRVDG